MLDVGKWRTAGFRRRRRKHCLYRQIVACCLLCIICSESVNNFFRTWCGWKSGRRQTRHDRHCLVCSCVDHWRMKQCAISERKPSPKPQKWVKNQTRYLQPSLRMPYFQSSYKETDLFWTRCTSCHGWCKIKKKIACLVLFLTCLPHQQLLAFSFSNFKTKGPSLATNSLLVMYVVGLLAVWVTLIDTGWSVTVINPLCCVQ